MTKPSHFVPGYRSGIAKALGLGDIPIRSLTLREPVNGLVTARVVMLVTQEQVDGLVEMIEAKNYALVELADRPPAKPDPTGDGPSTLGKPTDSA